MIGQALTEDTIANLNEVPAYQEECTEYEMQEGGTSVCVSKTIKRNIAKLLINGVHPILLIEFMIMHNVEITGILSQSIFRKKRIY